MRNSFLATIVYNNLNNVQIFILLFLFNINVKFVQIRKVMFLEVVQQ